MSDSFDMAALRAELERDEGKRRFPYYDTGQRISVGIGRNLSDVGLREDEITVLFLNDAHAAMADLDRNIPWWRSLDAVRQRVMLGMAFNMGWGGSGSGHGLGSFARFLSAMYQHRWDDAAIELVQSKWAGQVGDRAKRYETMIRTGQPV